MSTPNEPQQAKSLVSIAATIAGTIKCCSNNVDTTTNVTHNSLQGEIGQTINPIVKSASTMSTDLTPQVEEQADDVGDV